MNHPPSSPEAPGRIFALSIAAAACFAAFVLPFLAPLNHAVYSAAYTAGANNKLGTIALALLACVTLAVGFHRSRTTTSPQSGPPLSVAWLLTGAALTALWTAFLATLVTHAGIRYGEAAYFLERLRDLLQFRPHLYTQLEFPYGPLLLVPPAWAVRLLHLPLDPAFYAFLTALNVTGVLLTGYILNRLPLTRTPRRVLFVLSVFVQMHPLLGPNYALAKFTLPFAVLIFATRRATLWMRVLAFALGHLLAVLVSPELGVGLAAGILAWAAVTAWRERSPAPLAAALAPAFGYGVFLILYGRGFLTRLADASAGALNLVIEPLPHVYILLTALIWFAPLAVARALRLSSAQSRASQAALGDPASTNLSQPRYLDQGSLLAACFVLALGLLPGALGRADPLHVFFNAWGLLVLSCIGLERLSSIRSHIWLALLTLLAVQTQATNFRIYSGPLGQLLHAPSAQADFNLAQLQTITHHQPVATPALLHIPLADELTLRHAGLFAFDPNAGLADIWDTHGEQQKIERLRHFDWALIPSTPTYVQAEGSPNDARLKRWLRFGYRYPQRHAPYQTGALLQQELAEHWTVEADNGTTKLLHRSQ